MKLAPKRLPQSFPILGLHQRNWMLRRCLLQRSWVRQRSLVWTCRAAPWPQGRPCRPALGTWTSPPLAPRLPALRPQRQLHQTLGQLPPAPTTMMRTTRLRRQLQLQRRRQQRQLPPLQRKPEAALMRMMPPPLLQLP